MPPRLDLHPVLSRETEKANVLFRALEIHGDKFCLTPKERLVVAGAVHNARRLLHEHLGMAENKLKGHLKSVLRKCGRPSLDDVARDVWTATLAR